MGSPQDGLDQGEISRDPQEPGRLRSRGTAVMVMMTRMMVMSMTRMTRMRVMRMMRMRMTQIKVDERSAQVVLMTQEIGVCNITTTSALHPQPFIWLRMVVRRILVNF